MVDIVGALVAAFGVVFVAELGDKTQLLALGFGARQPLRLVAGGASLTNVDTGVGVTLAAAALTRIELAPEAPTCGDGCLGFSLGGPPAALILTDANASEGTTAGVLIRQVDVFDR